MNADYIYNPVLRETALDRLTARLSDIYYGSAVGQFSVDFAFLTGGLITVAAFLAVLFA